MFEGILKNFKNAYLHVSSKSQQNNSFLEFQDFIS